MFRLKPWETHNMHTVALAMAIAVVLVTMAPMAWAVDVNDVVGNVATSAGGVGDFIKVFVMVFGFGSMGFGLFSLTQKDAQPKHAIAMIVVGGLMLAVGASMTVILETLGLTSGVRTATPGVEAGGGGILDDFRRVLDLLWGPLVIITKVAGFGLFVYGMIGLINASSPRASVQYKQAFAAILIGAMFFNVEAAFNVMSQTMFNADTTAHMSSNFDYSSKVVGAGNEKAISAIKFAFSIIAIVGFFGFVTGLNGLRKAANSQSNEGIGASMTKLIGGSMAMNLDLVMKALNASTTDKGFNSIIKFFIG